MNKLLIALVLTAAICHLAFAQYTTDAPAARTLLGETYTNAPALTNSLVGPDASSVFLKESQIVAQRQQRAVNNLILRLQAANLWTNLYALWPLAGPLKTNQTYELVYPTNLISWNGAASHSTLGSIGKGTNTATTPFSPMQALPNNTNNWCVFGYFSWPSNAASTGIFSCGTSNGFAITNAAIAITTNNAQPPWVGTPILTNGLFIVDRPNATSLYSYTGSYSNLTSNALPNIMVMPDGPLQLFGKTGGLTALRTNNLNGRIMLLGFANALNRDQVTNLVDIIHKYQQSLLRNVE